MEFVWRPMSDHLGDKAQIFTHVLYNHYSAPDGFNWDTLGINNSFVDDPNLSTFNADNFTQ